MIDHYYRSTHVFEFCHTEALEREIHPVPMGLEGQTQRAAPGIAQVALTCWIHHGKMKFHHEKWGFSHQKRCFFHQKKWFNHQKWWLTIKHCGLTIKHGGLTLKCW